MTIVLKLATQAANVNTGTSIDRMPACHALSRDLSCCAVKKPIAAMPPATVRALPPQPLHRHPRHSCRPFTVARQSGDNPNCRIAENLRFVSPKNAFRDRSQAATKFPRRHPVLAATQRGARCFATRPTLSPPTPSATPSPFCRPDVDRRQNSPRDIIHFTRGRHFSSARTASSTSAVRGIPCCTRACSVTCTACLFGSSGACSIRACTCVISAPKRRIRHE